ANTVDWVSRALRHLAERPIEVIMEAVGFPHPIARLVSRMAAHAMLGPSLRVLGSVSHGLRVAGLVLCAAEGQPLGTCRCARGVVVRFLKQELSGVGREVLTSWREADLAPAIARSEYTINKDSRRFIERDVSLTDAPTVTGAWVL